MYMGLQGIQGYGYGCTKNLVTESDSRLRRRSERSKQIVKRLLQPPCDGRLDLDQSDDHIVPTIARSI